MGSYIVSPEWLKNKKATISPENNDDNCFLEKTLKESRKLNLLLINIIATK